MTLKEQFKKESQPFRVSNNGKTYISIDVEKAVKIAQQYAREETRKTVKEFRDDFGLNGKPSNFHAVRTSTVDLWCAKKLYQLKESQ